MDTTGATGAAKYAGPSAIFRSGSVIGPEVELKVGDILLAKESPAIWYPVDILEVVGKDRFRIHYRGWSSSWDKVVRRSELFETEDGIIRK